MYLSPCRLIVCKSELSGGGAGLNHHGCASHWAPSASLRGWLGAFCPSPAKEVRQLGDIDRDPARFVLCHQIGRRASARFFLIVERASPGTKSERPKKHQSWLAASSNTSSTSRCLPKN